MFYLNLNAYLWECNQFFIIHAPSMLHPCIPFITHASSIRNPCIIHVLSLLYSCTIRTYSIHHPYIIHTSIFFTVLLFYLQPHCYGIDTGSEPGFHHECIINIICALSMSYTYIGHVSSMHHQLSMVHPCNFDGMMMMVIEPTKNVS